MKLRPGALIALALLVKLVFISGQVPDQKRVQRPINGSIPIEFVRTGQFVATGQVRGQVVDPSGAVVPGVHVILRRKGFTKKTITSDDGTFHFDSVPIGNDYKLLFARVPRGFRIDSKKVSVTLNNTSNVNAYLLPAPVPTPSPAPSIAPTPRNTPTPFPTPIIIHSPSPFPTLTPFSSPGGSPTPGASPGPKDPIAEAMKQLLDKPGQMVFNAPDQMQQGRKERVEVRISAEDLGDAIKQGLKGTGVPQVESVPVSSRMKVVLTGDQDAFAIQGFSEEIQPVVGKVAQWDWDVTPLKSGTQNLHLQVTAIVFIQGRPDVTSGLPVKDKIIRVRVNPWFASKRFVSNNWQWLWTTLLIPAGGLLWRLRRKRARPAGFT